MLPASEPAYAFTLILTESKKLLFGLLIVVLSTGLFLFSDAVSIFPLFFRVFAQSQVMEQYLQSFENKKNGSEKFSPVV